MQAGDDERASTDLRIGLWLACVISQAVALGFVGLFTILIGVPALVAGHSIGLPSAAIGTVMTVGYMVALWRLVLRRKKFWSKPRQVQKFSVVLYILVGSAPVTIPIATWLMGLLI